MSKNLTIVGLVAEWNSDIQLPNTTSANPEEDIREILRAHLLYVVHGYLTLEGELIPDRTAICGMMSPYQDSTLIILITRRKTQDNEGLDSSPVTSWTLRARFSRPHPKLVIDLLRALDRAGCPTISAWGPPAKTSQYFSSGSISPSELLQLLKKNDPVEVSCGQ